MPTPSAIPTATNARIRRESFFQLRFYAWLLRERGHPATALRLLYLGDGNEMNAEVSDDDIDRTADEACAMITLRTVTAQ